MIPALLRCLHRMSVQSKPETLSRPEASANQTKQAAGQTRVLFAERRLCSDMHLSMKSNTYTQVLSHGKHRRLIGASAYYATNISVCGSMVQQFSPSLKIE